MIKDPIISAKIHFIKCILKKHAIASRENKKISKFNNKINIQDPKYSHEAWSSIWTDEKKAKLKTYIDSGFNNDTITLIHVYYLVLKEASKQHTKDDKFYVTKYNYQTTIQKLEKEFMVSQEVGREGNHV